MIYLFACCEFYLSKRVADVLQKINWSPALPQLPSLVLSKLLQCIHRDNWSCFMISLVHQKVKEGNFENVEIQASQSCDLCLDLFLSEFQILERWVESTDFFFPWLLFANCRLLTIELRSPLILPIFCCSVLVACMCNSVYEKRIYVETCIKQDADTPRANDAMKVLWKCCRWPHARFETKDCCWAISAEYERQYKGRTKFNLMEDTCFTKSQAWLSLLYLYIHTYASKS